MRYQTSKESETMKRIMTVLLVAVAAWVAVPAQAQISWGVKAGLNLSKADIDNISTKNSTGYFIGPMAEFTIPLIGLGVDGSLLYSHKAACKTDAGTANMNSIDIPVNLKYTFGLGSVAGIYVAAGPQFSWNIGDKSFTEYDFKLKSSTLSANIGAGVKLLSHLQAGINYNIALGDTSESLTEHVDAMSFKTNTWQVSVAYIF